MNNELEGLVTIDVNSRRGGGQNFDIEHSPEDNSFLVSDAFYNANDMNNNGFTTHYNTQNENVYLSVQSNEDSVSYRGREGYTKGKKFTATTTSEIFSKLGFEGPLNLVEVGDKDGSTYYRVENVPEEDSIQEEIAVDDSTSQAPEPETVDEGRRAYQESVAENH